MKLLTLNTHSLAEPNQEEKLTWFAQMINHEKPEIFALQEVNQTLSKPITDVEKDLGYIFCEGNKEPIREDNYALRLARRLKEMGCSYQWTWTAAKIGYKIYAEGLALFSCIPIEQTKQFFISRGQDFANWKTRKILGIQVNNTWYYSVHMGWWNDDEEPFAMQWNRAEEAMKKSAEPGENIWVLGDFNSPADKKGEGYEYVKASGWQDSYELAKEKDTGITVGGVIDGWRNTQDNEQKEGMRIDYIWCRQKETIHQSAVVCSGSKYPVVSDHYGVMIVK